MKVEGNNILVFDLWGDFGCFTKLETTVSPTTYPIPTGTAIAGLVSCILGYDRDSYYTLFSRDNMAYSVRPLNPVRKISISHNLIKTSKSYYPWKSGRKPTYCEFLKYPSYRIYLGLKHKDVKEELKTFLANQKSVYTPYLGKPENIANYSFVGEFTAKRRRVNGSRVEINSVLNNEKVEIDIDSANAGQQYIPTKISMYMNEDRSVEEFAYIIVEPNGKPISIKKGTYHKVGEDNIVFI